MFRTLLRFPVRGQFFLTYAFIGCLLPYLAIYLQEVIGFTDRQIGWLLAFSSVTIILSPVVLTAVADTRVSGARLLGWIFLGSSCSMLALALIASPWAAVVFFGLHMLLFISMIPLQDGLHFSVQNRREAKGERVTPYHQVRVWGTIGFIVPSLLLYFLLRGGVGLSVILYAAFAIGLIGFFNTLRLPHFEPGGGEAEKAKSSRLPTREAAEVLLQPRVLLFGIALFLAHMASSAYFGFYPLYLTREVGVDSSTAGLIFNFGVVVEIVFILAFGWGVQRFGLRKVLLVAMAAMALRMGLLALFPTVTMAVISQLLHGLVVIAIQVAPVIYLNSLAGERFRNSMQGLYAMVIMGVSRVIGHIGAGYTAEVSLLLLYGLASLITTVSFALLLLFFQETPAVRAKEKTTENLS